MKSDEQIVLELKQATEGLLLMSESDYPFEIVEWAGTDEISTASLQRLSGQPTDSPVSIQSLDDFFRPAVSETRADAKRYQALLQLLKGNLTDVKVYRVGEINIPVYIVGKSPTGNWLGLSTRVVET
jgi:hypothetical protein